MNAVEIQPIPHDQLKEHFPHVFNNSFETREIVDVWDNSFSNTYELFQRQYVRGNYTLVIAETSKGEREEIHFWKMDGDYKNNYQKKYCYSVQKPQ